MISQARLDVAPFPSSQLAHHAFGSGGFADLRVIESGSSTQRRPLTIRLTIYVAALGNNRGVQKDRRPSSGGFYGPQRTGWKAGSVLKKRCR